MGRDFPVEQGGVSSEHCKQNCLRRPRSLKNMRAQEREDEELGLDRGRLAPDHTASLCAKPLGKNQPEVTLSSY